MHVCVCVCLRLCSLLGLLWEDELDITQGSPGLQANINTYPFYSQAKKHRHYARKYVHAGRHC
jgi:hypothetical protein